MGVSELKGRVQTVIGPIDPGELGVTLMHEHLLIDLECYFQGPDEASERAWVDAPLTIDRLGGVGARVAYNLDNLKLLDEGAAIDEASRFRYAGGGTLVDVTSRGIARDPLALARISRATGLNVVMGASYYVPFAHPPDMDAKSEDEIVEEIVHDVTVGVGETGVRSGIIGEVGNFHPLSENERKVLRASAAAHLKTGAPITIHPGADRIEIVDILAKSGADPRHVVMGHLGPGPAEPSSFKPLAETGCFLQFDHFGGFEDTSFDLRPDLPPSPGIGNDVQRLLAVEFLVEQGHLDQVLISHDVCLKTHHVRNGGKGYAHILENIVPRMRRRGFTEDQINAILVENPKRALAFS